MAEVVRNIQVKLTIPESRHSDVDQTFEEFRQVAQHVTDHGWSDDPDHLIKAKNKLHKATYTEVREQTNLQASLVQSARNLAADALSNCKDLLEDDTNTSKPEFRGTVIVYNGRTITYNDNHVTLATIGNRVTAEYVLPHDDEGTPFEDYWNEDKWEKKEATLHKRDGEYYLHVAVEKDV
ncbi:RNA-guided endonuclease TnpB family protein, partial [Natrialbaceae archaeon A-CW3]